MVRLGMAPSGVSLRILFFSRSEIHVGTVSYHCLIIINLVILETKRIVIMVPEKFLSENWVNDICALVLHKGKRVLCFLD